MSMAGPIWLAPAGPFIFKGIGNVLLLVLALVVGFRWGSPENTDQFGHSTAQSASG